MQTKNLAEVQESSAHGFVRRRVRQSPHLHCNISCFEPGQQNALHRHPVADEAVYCWEGEGVIVVGEDHSPIKAGETAFMPADIPHGYLNTSPTRRMVMTVVQCPLPVEHVPVDPGDLTAVLHTRGVNRP